MATVDVNECAGLIDSTSDLDLLQGMADACNARLDAIHPQGKNRPPVGGVTAPKVSAPEPTPGVHADSPERTGIDRKAIAARERSILAGNVADHDVAVASHEEVYDTLEDRQRAADRKKKPADNPVFAHGEYDAPKAAADTAKHDPVKKPHAPKKK